MFSLSFSGLKVQNSSFAPGGSWAQGKKTLYA